jgi:tetratricopeptide (TPR) repeat protein
MHRLAILACLLLCAPLHAQDQRTLLRQGMRLENEGKIEEAITVYEPLLARYARNTSVLYRLASAYQKVGRFQDAVSLLQKRLARATNDITAISRLSDVYFTAGNAEEADRQIERMLSVSPQQSTYTSVGQRYERRNQDQKAIRVYRRGRQVLENPELFSRELGQIYERAENYPAAVGEYIILARQKPQYVSLVESKLQNIAGQTSDRRPLFELLLRNVKAAFRDNRGTRLFVTYAIAAGFAHDALQELLLLSPDAPIEGSLLRIGRETLESGDASDAIQAFQQLASRTENSALIAQARSGLAQALERSGSTTLALQVYKTVVNGPGNSNVLAECLYRMGRLHWRLRHVAVTISTLKSFSNFDDRSPWRTRATDLLADIYLATDRPDEAAKTYRTNIRENKGKEAALTSTYRLSRLLTIQGEYSAAQKALRSILKGATASYVYNDAIELAAAINAGLDEDATGLDAYARALMAEHRGDLLTSASAALDGIDLSRDRTLDTTRLRFGVSRLVEAKAWSQIEEVCEAVPAEATSVVSWTRLHLGISLERQGRIPEARDIYEGILVDFPDALDADRARERLIDLKSPSEENEAG